MTVIAVENTKTVENLLAAYEGESNAAAKYSAFAVQADADGWCGIASLFRAAARAEEIHAANHARVIKQLGGEAHCAIHPVDVDSTLENLKTALAGESYEIDSMYPEFVAEATEHLNKSAIRTFEYALEAEKTHARLYSEAIKLLESGKKQELLTQARDFFVCLVCGYTSEDRFAYQHCPVCNALWEKFELIR